MANIIGKQAEQIVYLYCACYRQYVFSQLVSGSKIAFKDRFCAEQFSLSAQQSRDFCELTVANEMQLVLASDEFRQQFTGELKPLFSRMFDFISPAAQQCVEQHL